MWLLSRASRRRRETGTKNPSSQIKSIQSFSLFSPPFHPLKQEVVTWRLWPPFLALISVSLVRYAETDSNLQPRCPPWLHALPSLGISHALCGERRLTRVSARLSVKRRRRWRNSGPPFPLSLTSTESDGGGRALSRLKHSALITRKAVEPRQGCSR